VNSRLTGPIVSPGTPALCVLPPPEKPFSYV